MKIYSEYNLLWIDNEVYPHNKLCLSVSGNMITIWNYETGKNLVNDVYSNILDINDAPYENVSDLLDVVKDFFANATQLLEARVANIEALYIGKNPDGSVNLGSALNYIKIDANGNLTLNGDATVFDDLTASITTIKTVGVGVSLNDAEVSIDFSNSSNLLDYAVLSYQMPHSWKIGSVIYPHIHWEQANNITPNFLIQYRWQDQGNTKTTSWTNYPITTNAFAYTSGTINQISFKIAGLTPPLNAGLSDIIQFRVIRDNANDSGAFSGIDTYPATVAITSVDIHTERDTLGSNSEYAK